MISSVFITVRAGSRLSRGGSGQVVHDTHNVQLAGSVWQQPESSLRSKVTGTVKGALFRLQVES